MNTALNMFSKLSNLLINEFSLTIQMFWTGHWIWIFKMVTLTKLHKYSNVSVCIYTISIPFLKLVLVGWFCFSLCTPIVIVFLVWFFHFVETKRGRKKLLALPFWKYLSHYELTPSHSTFQASLKCLNMVSLESTAFLVISPLFKKMDRNAIKTECLMQSREPRTIL